MEQSLPLVNKAQSLAWPFAWLAILTKPKSLPNLWSWVWSTRTFGSSFCTSSHQVICSDHRHWAKLLEPDYPDYWAWLLSLTTLTTSAWLPWLPEPNYPDYLSVTTLTTLTTWAWLSLTLSLNVWQPSSSCWQFDSTFAKKCRTFSPFQHDILGPTVLEQQPMMTWVKKRYIREYWRNSTHFRKTNTCKGHDTRLKRWYWYCRDKGFLICTLILLRECTTT